MKKAMKRYCEELKNFKLHLPDKFSFSGKIERKELIIKEFGRLSQ